VRRVQSFLHIRSSSKPNDNKTNGFVNDIIPGSRGVIYLTNADSLESAACQ
jgi:hypothetical protein